MTKSQTDIAIVGMSCIFPGAQSKEMFWQNIVNKIDSTQMVPDERIDKVYFEEGPSGVDRFYCNRGGFIPDFDFDAAKFGILPLAVEGTEPDHLITLSLVQKALEDAGIFDKKLSLEKTGIIIGKGNYTGPGATRAIEIVRTGEQIASVLKDLLPDLDEATIQIVKKEFQSRKGRFGPDTAMGLIPNLVASLVANRFNMGGVAYTVDAACASSLIAVDHAVTELNNHRSDMMIAGGVHVGQNAAFWSIFTQLGALSKKGKISPFDTTADGLIIGEGCGFVVLKRLEEAVKANDRIYAVIKGIGVSSDGSGTSVMSPSVKGQLKALNNAWKNTDIDINQIGYIEAHGTGTPLGDKTEIASLSQFFGSDNALPKAGIGSVKSNIGHAMPAAGIAGLIKTAMALYHNIIPPTLHCSQPLAQLQNSRFKPVQEAQNWDASGLPKIAAINAFGFGGINAHVVLQGFVPKREDGVQQPFIEPKIDKVLLLARHSVTALMSALLSNDNTLGDGQYRLAIFDPTPERITKASKIIAKNLPWRNKQDIWFTNEPLLQNGGKIAFVFPGLDGLAGGEIMSVAKHFNIAQHHDIEEKGLLKDALALLDKSHVLDTAIKQLGVFPDMNAGHSMGEWLAAKSSGLAEEESVMQLLTSLNPETFDLKDSRFIAIGCGMDKLTSIVQGIDQLYLSNDNCPQQVILCGNNAALEQLVPILKAKQIYHQILPFQSGFHSPFIEDKIDVILEGMDKMKFRKTKYPLWSATTLELYPESLEEIKALSVEHLIKPVRFRELTDKLYAEGARVFIQIDSGGLIGFIDDTLKGKSYSAIAANVAIRPGIAQIQRVLAALFVEGKVTGLKLMGYDTDAQPSKTGIQLKLGQPLIKNIVALKNLAAQSLPKKYKQLIKEEINDPVLKAFNENVAEMIDFQSEMLEAFQNRVTNKAAFLPSYPAVEKQQEMASFTSQLDISLQNSPYLIDHSLLRQPTNWHCVDDMDPVIPMTMIFELFAEIAAAHAHGKLVHKILNIKVFQWMNVAKPFQETITGEWKNSNLVYLNLERFASAEVLLHQQVAHTSITHFDTGKPLDINRTAEQIYAAHMFHGPAYQGIKKLVAVGEKGITGIITSAAGKGSLLDNAGQLFGLWLQLTLTKDRIAFPVKINEIEFFGDFKDQDGLFECTCVLTEMNEEFASADFVLNRNGQTWAIIKGWQNRRLEIDEKLWNVSMAPLKNSLSEEVAPGVFMFQNVYSRVVSWDFILKRYFNQNEKKHHAALLPNKRKEWMISRVAVKDAVRDLLKKSSNKFCFPIEFQVMKNEEGKPYLHGALTEGINISIAHKGTDAVGIARFDKPVGIDIELIAPRSTIFFDMVFTESEQALMEEKEKDEWSTRFWVAKEAYGKYLGKGLKGNPKAYVVEAINGDEISINNTIIKTIKHKNYIIGWTK